MRSLYDYLYEKLIDGFDTDNARDADKLAKKYMPVVSKMVRIIIKKAAGKLNYDDLYSAGLEILTVAINKYDSSTGISFNNYLEPILYNKLINEIRNNANTVKLPFHKTKLGNWKDYDFTSVDGKENSIIDKSGKFPEDKIVAVWDKILADVKSKFKERDYNIWCHRNGIDGHELLSGGETAEKFNVTDPTVSNVLAKIKNYLQKNKLYSEVKEIFGEINEIS